MIFTLPEAPFAMEFTTWAASNIPHLADSGLSGYLQVTVDSAPPVDLPGVPDKIAGLMGNTMILDTQDEAEIYSIFQPLNETIEERWPGQAFSVFIIEPFDSWWDWFSVHFDPSEAGGSFYLISRLLDKNLLTNDLEVLSDALEPVLINDGWLATYIVAGTGVHDAEPRGGGNSVHPAWRTAYVHACKYTMQQDTVFGHIRGHG